MSRLPRQTGKIECLACFAGGGAPGFKEWAANRRGIGKALSMTRWWVGCAGRLFGEIAPGARWSPDGRLHALAQFASQRKVLLVLPTRR